MIVSKTIASVAVLIGLVAGPAFAVNIETVPVGNPGNADDSTGYGSVGYVYQMGKYQVTTSQYREFLTAKAVTDSYGLYKESMSSSVQGDSSGFLIRSDTQVDASGIVVQDDDVVVNPFLDLGDMPVSLSTCPGIAAPTGLLATPETVCPGGTIQLSATAGAGGDTVDWFTGGCGVFAVPGGAAPLVVLNEATTFYARTRDSASGCVSDTCAFVRLYPIRPPLDPSGAAAAPARTCAGGDVRLSATPGYLGDSLAWYADTCGGTPIAEGSSPTVHPTASTTYYAKTLNSTTGCTSTGCVSVVVTVQNRVGPDLNGDCHVDADDLAQFVACMTGTHVGGMSATCHNADFDLDDDVDQSDFGILQRCLSGEDDMADPNCAT